MSGIAERLAALAEQTLEGRPLPLRIRAWDGSEAGPEGAPVVVLNSRQALRRLLWKPGNLGLARAWVAGDLDVEGDLYEALDRLGRLLWHRDDQAGRRRRQSLPAALRALSALARPRQLRAGADLLALAGPTAPPKPPPEETPVRRGPLHTLRRDSEAISHHYDVGNDFYSLVLGPSMVYSCAYWEDEAGTLEDAQRAKLDLICRKLQLRPDQTLLDVGCGWGSLVLHAVEQYGVRAVGITISEEQAGLARKRLAEAGLTDRAEIRVQDYREVADGPYDAISSVGMAEHVGAARFRTYGRQLYGLLRPGGRLLNHQISRRPSTDTGRYRTDEFIDRYVFPDGELETIGSTVELLERSGFEVRDVESIREHYALTLRAWVTNLERHRAAVVAFTTPGRVRVWHLYMAASALAFERNRIGVNQVLAVRTPDDGDSGMPRTRARWLGLPPH
ncbi:class I SAM-dependent methyltransferase [Streptomyces sp. XM4193]|uniref:class I SAM-dependent methyltransferase n=1 Tax=Streptomyces sp. XM4193 TaxID=2929782 RepID=UPI001FF90918|nr:class I SAM-dependent methyltransferase [Streptomyces sp. XM4193]MCK1796912.1 class I SAM-dependent methyltransferase [Streptomyces sp. XM4193]